MKVKISFTVDMENVPHEVNVRLYNTHNKLNEIKKDCLKVDINAVDSTMSQITNLRKQLLDIDTTLSDCYNILTGYNDAINGVESENESNVT